MTPAQQQAWDAAGAEQRALWLMSPAQRRQWNRATAAQHAAWLEEWSRLDNAAAQESWWQIGVPMAVLTRAVTVLREKPRDVALAVQTPLGRRARWRLRLRQWLARHEGDE